MGENSPRVIFVGDSGVGKTSLIHRCKNNKFNETTTPTIGAGITHMESMFNGKEIRYQLWDTTGQEIYRSIVPIYFKGAICAIIVFSLEERQSFVSLQSWVEQLMNHADENIGVVICGNKTDVANPTVSQAEAEKWAQERGYTIIFTSAYTGENVQLLLDHVVANWVGKACVVRTERKIEIKQTDERGCC